MSHATPNPQSSSQGQPVLFSILSVVVLTLLAALPLLISPFFQVADKSEASVEDSSKDKKEEDKAKDKENYIRILNADGTHAVAWKAEEAVKFSLDQVVIAINYVFVAAAAGLALVGRYVVEQPAPTTASQPLSRNVLILLGLASLLWIGSLVSGMFAHVYLVEIATKTLARISGDFFWRWRARAR